MSAAATGSRRASRPRGCRGTGSPGSTGRYLRCGWPGSAACRCCAGLDTGLPVRSASVDVVIMSEVIEHLVDTDSAIEEAHRVLKPGGSLLLSTPNLAAWYNRALLAVGVQPVFSEVSMRSVFGRPGSQVAGHLRMFTRRALVEFLAAYGLRAVQVRGACYHDVPAPLRPLDRVFCHWPSVASILLVQARKAG